MPARSADGSLGPHEQAGGPIPKKRPLSIPPSVLPVTSVVKILVSSVLEHRIGERHPTPSGGHFYHKRTGITEQIRV
jgi:hypothetical protein